MANYLVTVGSLVEVKIIKKSLGVNYEIDASGGHVRDLPKNQLGFDVERDYEPKHITIRGKGDVLAKLRKGVKEVDKIYLATDPSREGEAISWYLMEALRLDEFRSKDVYRISFSEITKNMVKVSFKTSRGPDMNLVNTRQTRRMLDRMVSYWISPFSWAKVKRGLSASRMQSVTLQMICDREDGINTFVPEEYWNLEAGFLLKGNEKPLAAKCYGTKDSKSGKIAIRNKEELDQTLGQLEGCRYEVEEVKRRERVEKVPTPFTTSTLWQEASKVLNFSTQGAVHLAQQLHGGVEVKGKGALGLITYLRTDSTGIANETDTVARAFIKGHYGEEHAARGDQAKEEGAKIQDAHEAIRPTDITLTPTIVKGSPQRDLLRLYQLVQKWSTASRMAPAVCETAFVKIGAGSHLFTTSASKLGFEGFMSVRVGTNDEEKKSQVLGNLEKGAVLKLEQLDPSQHFTQPPTHYTEASLVKAPEEQDTGRPSTHVPTITTIIARRYVAKENKNLCVTELGGVVNRIMKNPFPSIADPNFTASMESLLDRVADDAVVWRTIVNNFYPDLDEVARTAEKELELVKTADEVPDVACDLCGCQMVIKYNPHDKLLACSGFPEYKNIKPYLEKIGILCPKCDKELVRRKTKRGRLCCGCEANPNCDFISWQKPSTQRCPVCGSYMVEKGDRLLCTGETCRYRVGKTEKQKNL